MNTDRKKDYQAPFNDSTLFAVLDDGKIEVWVSNHKKINYNSLYKTMIELNKKMLGTQKL